MKSQVSRKMSKRNRKGTTLLELPIAIWLIFVMLLMPMLSMATMGLRYAILNVVVANAAQAAARAKTFEAVSSDGKPPATQVAPDTMAREIGKFSGMSVQSVAVGIVQTPVNSGAPTRTTAKLAQPADTSRNIYQIETSVRGQIQPLFLITPALIGNVPGVSAPLPVTFVAREMAENPQGLNK